MKPRVVSARLTMAAIDVGDAVLLTSAGEKALEVLQLGYETGTNTTNSIPRYHLMASDSGPAAVGGVYDLSKHDVFHIVNGPTGATAGTPSFSVWPTHAKTNLAGAFIIPPGYLLLVEPGDNDMDGTIVHTCITCECRE